MNRYKFKDIASVKDEVEHSSNNEYTVVSKEYSGCFSKILIKHRSCGTVYSVTANNYFHRGKKCPKCYGRHFNHKKSTEEYQKDFSKVSNGDYKLLSSYKNCHVKVKIKHITCGRCFLMAPSRFLGRPHCPICGRERSASSKVKNTEWFSSKLVSILGESYQLVGKYTSSYTPVTIKHSKCGKTYTKTPREIIDGHVGCPYCSRISLGEVLILEFLDSKGIKYEYQKTFSQLEDKKKLSYDFFLPEYKVLIEYQGIQHYIPRSFGSKDADSTLNNFVTQLYHDYLKKTFAEENQYKLVPIKYTVNTHEKVDNYLSSILFCKAEEPLPK